MKSLHIVKLVASLLLLAMVSSLAVAQQIATTEHDLSGTNTANDNSRICVYCHTPHNANGGVVPLWNRDFTTSAFTMYDSPTIDMTTASAPQGVSLACLSCHDGTIAVDQLFGDPWASDGTKTVGGSAKLGTDLSNDHPISITYDTTADTAFVAASGGKVGILPLFGTTAAPGVGDQVECASCHSVHDDSIMPFLRKSNAGSALCLTCHIK